MKIAIATIFYQCKTELQRLVDSIPGNTIHKFIGIDGVFKYTKEKYPCLPDYSEDGSRQVILDAKQFPNRSVLTIANSTEYEKRNFYLEVCSHAADDCEIDILLIVDSDEYFSYPDPTISREEAWTRFKKNLELELIKTGHQHNVFGITTYDVATRTSSYCPRIWYKPGEMRYLNNSHYHYGNVIREKDVIEQFNKQKLNYIQHARAIIKAPLILNHDHSLRSEEYQERRKDYQKYLVRFEELVQSHRFDPETAHKMAKQRPHETFEPTK